MWLAINTIRQKSQGEFTNRIVALWGHILNINMDGVAAGLQRTATRGTVLERVVVVQLNAVAYQSVHVWSLDLRIDSRVIVVEAWNEGSTRYSPTMNIQRETLTEGLPVSLLYDHCGHCGHCLSQPRTPPRPYSILPLPLSTRVYSCIDEYEPTSAHPKSSMRI